MSEEDKSSKTEEPTDRRLAKARREGDTAASREPGTAAALVALLVAVAVLAPALLEGLAVAFGGLIARAPALEAEPGAAGLRDLGTLTMPLLHGVAVLLLPVMGALLIAGLFGALAQGEIVLTAKRLMPKWSKISPVAGAKRMFSPDALVEFAKNFAKVVVIVVATWIVGVPAVTSVWTLVEAPPGAVMAHAGRGAAQMLVAAAAMSVALAILDVVWKRMRWRAKQKMSLKEVRDEHKDSDGDPLLRSRRDGIRRQRARQRIATAVPSATVVITNPTHYAVALRYEAGRDAAPVCVAKGTERVAARIRELAREAEVPMVENRPLARALHASVDVDAAVPVEHWKAVAEIIGYVHALRHDAGRRPPPPGPATRAGSRPD